MTSDAKVGLLLGLFFIFVIAFIINGLPRFHNDTNGNELTTMANSPNDSFIGSNERKAQETLLLEMPVRSRRVSVEETHEPTRTEDKVRYRRPLSQDNAGLNSEHLTTVSQEKVKPTTPVPDSIIKFLCNFCQTITILNNIDFWQSRIDPLRHIDCYFPDGFRHLYR